MAGWIPWAMPGTNKFGACDLEEFLRTGDRQVNHLMTYISRFGYPHRHTHVLDYGCGVGRLARGFRNHFSHYLGLDIADSLISKAREIYRTASNTDFRVNNGAELSYLADNSIDLVYCWGVLHHISEQSVVQQFLSEFVRLLDTDGLLVFTVIHEMKPAHRVQLRRRLFAILSRLGVPETTLYQRLSLYPQQVHASRRDQLVAHLKGIGGNILAISPDEAPKNAHQYWTYYVTQ